MRRLVISLAVVVTACGGETSDDGSGGSSGATGRPSCRARSAGADGHCGADGSRDCCGWGEVPGGTFNRLNDPKLPATLSAFSLDLFEATQGRFRAFIEAYPASRPKPGDGAHAEIEGSGWKSDWDKYLPETQPDLLDGLKKTYLGGPCVGWTETPAQYEALPMPCATWFEAFAFCAWDGGRLPTQAEWNFAAAGGEEQRANPWGDDPYDPSRALYASYEGDTSGAYVPVGSRPAGIGRWGHYDLGGSRFEWVLDAVGGKGPQDNKIMPTPCIDCAELDPKLPNRVERDISYHQFPVSVVESVFSNPPSTASDAVGVRCVYAE